MVVFQQNIVVIVVMTSHDGKHDGDEKQGQQQQNDHQGQPNDEQFGQNGNHNVDEAVRVMDYRHDDGSNQTQSGDNQTYDLNRIQRLVEAPAPRHKDGHRTCQKHGHIPSVGGKHHLASF